MNNGLFSASLEQWNSKHRNEKLVELRCHVILFSREKKNQETGLKNERLEETVVVSLGERVLFSWRSVAL